MGIYNKIKNSCNSVLNFQPYHKLVDENEIDSEISFFSRIKMSNKVYKKTDCKRFEDLNYVTNKILKERFNNKIQIQDVAVSSGITTLEWYENLKSDNINFDLQGGDAYISCNRTIIIPKYFEVIGDENGHIYEFNIGNLVFQGLMYCPLSILFFPFAWILYKLRKLFKNIPLYLITFKSKSFPEVKFKQDDILDSTYIQECKFHCIRACNIINLSYFNELEINNILANIYSRLKEGGLFIINRSNKSGVNNASFYLKKENSFINIKNLNEGSEIHNIVEKFSQK